MSAAPWYFAGFVVAVAVIIAVSQWVWNREIASLPTPPHWLEAFKIVWVEWYLMPWESRPRVIWVRGKTFVCSTGKVVAGEADSVGVTVAVETDTTPVSATAFCHELWHVALRLKGMDPDGPHLSAAWGSMGIVGRAESALRSKGW